MPGFKLEKGSDKYDFDTLGAVKKNGAEFGTWTTSKDRACQIVATKAGGTPGGIRREVEVQRDEPTVHICG